MRSGTSSRTLTIAILLVFAMVALGQLTKERPAQGLQQQQQNATSSTNSGKTSTAQTTTKESRSNNATSTNSGGTQNSNETTANNLTIRGCLMQGKEGYTLQQDATQTTFQLMGTSGQFDGYTGKTVEVRGREMEPLAQGTDLPRFRVDALKVVSDQCAVAPKAARPNSAAPSDEHNIEPDATPRYERTNPVQSPPAVPVNPNTQGVTGAPSAGTGNPPPPQKPPVF